MNPKSILVLYEGDTESEFYRPIIHKYLARRIRISHDNLKGINLNLNLKVATKVNKHLDLKSDEMEIYVFVAHDREGPASKETMFDEGLIRKRLEDNSRVKEICEVVATQEIESYFFYDYEGICKFLSIPKKEQNPSKYSNPESLTSRDLNELFRRYRKSFYLKGKGAYGLISCLDEDKIISSCNDLKKCLDNMLKLI